jgi:hypothetical protein
MQQERDDDIEIINEALNKGERDGIHYTHLYYIAKKLLLKKGVVCKETGYGNEKLVILVPKIMKKKLIEQYS